MKTMIPSKNRDLAALLLVLVGLVISFHLVLALTGHGRCREQHLGTALHYAATKIDLAHTVIVGFNATETPTIQELPVWQMAAGAAFKVFGPWWGWANVVSLLFFLSCLYPLFQVVRQFYGDRVAWWALIFFLAQGLVFIYAGEAGTDGFCLSVSLWFWFACVRLIEQPVKWFLPAAALGTLLAVSKLPFFMAVGLASFFLLLKMRGCKIRTVAPLAGVGIISGIHFLFWTHYTDATQMGAVFPYLDLRLSAPPTNGMSMMFWYFGDLHYRLSPGNWIKAAWRFSGAAFGSFVLRPLFIFALVGRWVNPVAKYFFVGAFLTTLVFTHLILHHYHYLMLFSPAVAILCAAAWTQIEKRVGELGIDSRLTTATAAAIVFLALFQGLTSMRAFSFDVFPAQIASAIRANTTPSDKLIILNGGWGDELIHADRNGLSMWNAAAFEDVEKYAHLKKLGFNKMVIVSESPFQNAVQIVNPGQTGIPRLMAKEFVTPRVEKWPTIFANENIVIKEIP